MTTAYTNLLGFALPVTGELNGTWGDVVNNSITQLVEDSVAGQATASVTSGNWTLTTTGSGAANQARCAILIPTGTPGVTRNIIAPSSSKAYIVDNQSNAAVVLKGAATTGVTIAANTAMLCAWDGSDFVAVGSTGTVTAVSVASANGFAGTSSGGATPALTLSTSVTGVIKGNGTAISAATAGTDYLAPPAGTAILKANSGGALANATANTDYLAPALANTAVTGFKTATFNSQFSRSGTTGAQTVDWTVAQNQLQPEPTGAITYTFTAPPGPCHLQLLINSDGTSTAQTITWPASVIWLGATYAGTNNKKSIVNFWYDGTNYYGINSTQV